MKFKLTVPEMPIDQWKWSEPPPRDDEAFQALMGSLDSHLASHLPDPSHRALNAIRLICLKFGVSSSVFPSSQERGSPYSPADLIWRVNNWYKEMYGQRNLVDFSPGSIAVVFRGAVWELRFPRYWGGMRVFADRNLGNEGTVGGLRGLPSYNVLCAMQGLTQAMASSLTNEEVATIETHFMGGLPAIKFLDEVHGHDFFEHARVDYRHGVQALISTRELHHAKWQLAHAAEKLTKGLLGSQGHPFPAGRDGHHIPTLGSLLGRHFNLVIPSQVLADLHCEPRARYGEVPVDLGTALKSQAAFVEYVRTIAPAFRGLVKRA